MGKILRENFGKGDLGRWLAAAAGGDAATIAAMISAGFPLESRRESHSRTTALLLAAEHGQPECMKLLVAAGADVSFRDLHGNGAMFMAVAGKSAECVDVAIHAGCPLDDDDAACWGGTPAALAAMGSAPALARLIAAGIDPHQVDRRGETLPILAARSFQPECLLLLIAAGVDVGATLDDGRSAALAAVLLRDFECVEILSQAGCSFDGILEKVAAAPYHSEDPATPAQLQARLDACRDLVHGAIARREARCLAAETHAAAPLSKRRSL